MLWFLGFCAAAEVPVTITVLDDDGSPVPEAEVVMECTGRVGVFKLDRAGTPWVTPFHPTDGPCAIRVSHPYLLDARVDAGLPVLQRISLRMSTCGSSVTDAPRRRRRCRRAMRKYRDYLRRLSSPPGSP